MFIVMAVGRILSIIVHVRASLQQSEQAFIPKLSYILADNK